MQAMDDEDETHVLPVIYRQCLVSAVQSTGWPDVKITSHDAKSTAYLNYLLMAEKNNRPVSV